MVNLSLASLHVVASAGVAIRPRAAVAARKRRVAGSFCYRAEIGGYGAEETPAQVSARRSEFAYQSPPSRHIYVMF